MLEETETNDTFLAKPTKSLLEVCARVNDIHGLLVTKI